MKKFKKIVLAYSGGLDTSIIIPWLKENYEGCEVIAVAGRRGPGRASWTALEEKAIKTGASKVLCRRSEQGICGGRDHLAHPAGGRRSTRTSICWAPPLPAPSSPSGWCEIAKAEGADAICHGCTGKGNDQVRFELAIKAFAARHARSSRPGASGTSRAARRRSPTPRPGHQRAAEDQPRDQLLQGQEPVASVPRGRWSWRIPGQRAQVRRQHGAWACAPRKRPIRPSYVSIDFEKGVPVALNGQKYGFRGSHLESSTSWAASTAWASSTSWRTVWWA